MTFYVDGTLVDSNDAHAWVVASAEHGITVTYESVRRAIGMGGDKLMPLVAGLQEESAKAAKTESLLALLRSAGVFTKHRFKVRGLRGAQSRP